MSSQSTSKDAKHAKTESQNNNNRDDEPTEYEITLEELKKLRKQLPIFQYREDLLNAMEQVQSMVVIGETGSGKSTQIAQYLYEEGYGKKGVIGITQPRRVGAVSVARRVADECGCDIGEEVGYTVRFNDSTSSRTVIKYMTDGVLLRECLLDPDLKQYSVIILDEAHERSVNTDILFGLMKLTILRRPDLKVLITSATLDEGKFSTFFHECPVFYIPGRSYPVEIFYMDEHERVSDFIDTAMDTVIKVHEHEPQGDVLVFLPGQPEIEEAVKRLNKKFEKLKTRKPNSKNLLILPLYAALPPGEQVKVFAPPPANTRKIVISTNIAETSVTVDGIVYVIDPGWVKQKGFNPTTGMESLEVCLISQVAAQQRAGRAGRTQPGKCYRLYSKQQFEKMEVATMPEIQRSNLSNVILTLKAMGITDVITFEFLDKPDPLLFVQAMKHLCLLGALDEDGKITELGRQMSLFPLDPSYSKMLLTGLEYHCEEELATIIAMMSVENLFYKPAKKTQQETADEKRRELYQEVEIDEEDAVFAGDHIFLLHIYNQWRNSRHQRQFCDDYFIHARHMEECHEIKKQLLEIIEQHKLNSHRERSARENAVPKVSQGASKLEKITRCLCSGLFMNIAKKIQTQKRQNNNNKDKNKESKEKPHSSSEYTYLVLNKNQITYPHPQSAILLGKKAFPEWVVFAQLISTTKVFIRLIFGIQYDWVAPFIGANAPKADVNRLIGRDAKDILEAFTSQPQKNKANPSEDAELQQKFARKNDDSSIQAARERYLARKQASAKPNKKH